MACEPWDGYDKLSVSERRALLQLKLADIEDRQDWPYGLALCAAVSCHEKLRRARGQKSSALMEREGEESFARILSWQRS
jgi:hypothetical protein